MMPPVIGIVVLVLAVIGAWQIFNYEDIFIDVRAWLRRRRWLKAIWCPPCNALWISAIGVISITMYPEATTGPALTLAVYIVVRTFGFLTLRHLTTSGTSAQSADVPPAPTASPTAPCGDCGH
jgi:hypothetical protein